MSENSLKSIISIGYAKRALEDDSRELQRMQLYAAALEELHVIVFTHKNEGFTEKHLDNLHVYPTNASTKLGMLWSAYKIGKKIKKSKPAVSWVVTSQDPFETSLVGRGIVRDGGAVHHVQMHGDLFNPQTYKGSFLQRFRVLYGRFVVKRTVAIRVVSNRIKKSLQVMGVTGDISVVPIQADLNDFLKAGKERNYARTGQTSFLYVGRFSDEKNLPLLIKSFRAVSEKFPGVSLSLLGSGSTEAQIKRITNELGLEDSVKILGWSNDVRNIMLQHDVLCLSSNHEGWGMVLLEAAATGMPVVSTDVGCVGEVVFDQDNGKVVPVGDQKRYTEAMRVYCDLPDLIEEHGRKGADIAAQFAISEDEFVAQVIEAYPSPQQ